MSAFTTLRLTKNKALEILAKAIIDDMATEDTKVIERLLDDVLAKRLYNVQIVDNDCTENDDNEIYTF